MIIREPTTAGNVQIDLFFYQVLCSYLRDFVQLLGHAYRVPPFDAFDVFVVGNKRALARRPDEKWRSLAFAARFGSIFRRVRVAAL
jgi:hypothetical protein